MKNYVIKPGIRGMFSVDTENDQYDVIDYHNTTIDWMYVVPEDGVIDVILEDGKSERKTVKKNDIVIVFYKKPSQKHRAVVVKNKEWKENIIAAQKYEIEQMRANAEPACECCGTCCECESKN